MNTILTRTLMVTLLATSISAFAQSNDGRTDQVATSSNATEQVATSNNGTQQAANCDRKAPEAATQDKQNSSDDSQIEQQDKEWQHDLLGDFGG